MKTIKGPAIFLAQFAGKVTETAFDGFAGSGDNAVALRTLGLAS